MNYAMMLGGLVGFAPALYLIWLCLKDYSYPKVEGSLFEDRRVFFMLAVGMVAGSLIFALELGLYSIFIYEGGIDLILFLLIFVLGFVFLEDMAKFIILNFKGYRGRFDSMFYGVALGAGFSATTIVGRVMVEANGTPGGFDFIDWLGLILLSASTCMVHVSVGATLGAATGKNQGMRAIPTAVLPHIVFNMLMFPWFVYSQIWYSLVLVLPISAFIFWGVLSKTIPESLPQEIQKELRRGRRRKTR